MQAKRIASVLAFIAGFCLSGACLLGQVPKLINYQGRVVVGGTNFSGTGQFGFALVSGTGGATTYWSNDGTSAGGSQPASAVSLPVSSGLYSVELGDTTLANMTALPYSVFANSDVRLRVWFNDGSHGWQQLAPDQRIVSVGYAMTSGSAMQSGTAGFAVTSGSAMQSGTANFAVSAGTVLISSSATFASQSGTAGYSLTSGTAAAATSGTATALASNLQPAGILYVTTLGNDATGVRNDIGHPFATISTALSSATTGDIVQVGPGTFAGFSTGKSDVWIRGSGMPDYAAGDSHLVGGTILHGEVDVVALSGATLSGVRCSDFGVDNGPVLSGSGAIYDGLSTGSFSDAGASPTPDGIINCLFEHIAFLGVGPTVAGSANIQHAFSFQSCIHCTFNDLRCRETGHGFVFKSRLCNISNLIAYNCGFEGVDFKSNGAVLYSNHLACNNVIVQAAPTGILFQDPVAANTPAMGNITLSNVHTMGCSGGITIASNGTVNPVTGIEVTGWVSDGDGLGDNVVWASGTATQPIRASFTGCTANNDSSGFLGLGALTYINCQANGCTSGYELIRPDEGYGGPEEFSDFIGCTAYNCGNVVQVDEAGPYLLRHPIITTGTYSSTVYYHSGGNPILECMPVIYRQDGGFSVSNTAAVTELWQSGGSCIASIPPQISKQHIRITTQGTYTVSGTGVHITFYPSLGGNGPGSSYGNNNAISAVITGGTTGTYRLVRDIATRYNGYGSSPNLPNTFNTLWIDNKLYSSATGYAPFGENTDQLVDEYVKMSAASTANTVAGNTVTIEVLDDPISGY